MLKIESLKKAMENKEITELPANTFPGLYPLVYVSSYGNVYCAECAKNLIIDPYEDITDYFPYMEGSSITCEDCGIEIESAYGDSENPENE